MELKLRPLDRNKLIRAVHVAAASSQRREFPIDHGSWERILNSIDTFCWLQAEHLSQELPASLSQREPWISIQIPKPDGSMRLKALPSPDELVRQQYLLSEVLSGQQSAFAGEIPAVRWEPDRHGEPLRTTGLTLPDDQPVVSFAYQVRADIVDGDLPPGREGIFRPYMDCWRDFLKHIAARSSRIEAPLLHPVRLDVRKFYNHVSRDAVIDFLEERLCAALAEGSVDPSRIAPLLSGDVGNTERRGRQLAERLADSVFGYRYVRPDRIQPGHSGCTSSDPLLGLPQGPDLSAWLANIVLFGLDRRLASQIELLDKRKQADSASSGAVAAVYARYVDDIVIVADSIETSRLLQSLVVTELTKLGLELSPKTDPLPSMTPRQVQGWLSEQRASGPFEEADDFDLTELDDLLDAGDFDRSNSLKILHSSEILELSREDALYGVRSSLSPEKLRYGDLAQAAFVVWHVALQAAETLAQVGQQFVTDWRLVYERQGTLEGGWFNSGQGNGPALEPEAKLLVWLDGLERVIVRRWDRRPDLPRGTRDRIHKARMSLATAVLESDLIDELRAAAGTTGRTMLAHSLWLKEACIWWAARCAMPEDSLNSALALPTKFTQVKTPPQARLLATLDVQVLYTRAEGRATGSYRDLVYHEAVALLSCQAPEHVEHGGPGQIERLLQRIGGRVDGSPILTSILEAWSNRPLSEGPYRAEIAGTYWALTRHCLPWLAQNQHAVKEVLQRDATAVLPIPMGLGIQGVLLSDRDSKRLTAVNMAESRNEQERPPHPYEVWEDSSDGVSVPGIEGRSSAVKTESRVGLSIERLEPSAEQIEDAQAAIRWLSSMFESLLKDPSSDDAEARVVVHPGSLFVVSEGERSEPKIIGFPSPVDAQAGLAFVVEAEGNQRGLRSVPIPHGHERVWRIGVSLACALRRYRAALDVERTRLQAEYFAGADNSHWCDEAMLRFALFRLSGGAWHGRRGGEGVPGPVRRILSRLARYPNQPGPNPVKIAHLLALWTELRGLNILITAGVGQEQTSQARCMELLGERLLRAQDQLDRFDSPPVALAIRPHLRRPVQAWLSAASRLKSLLSGDEDVDSGLRCLCAALNMRALVSQLRCMVLELLTKRELPGELALGLALETQVETVSPADSDSASRAQMLLRLIDQGTSERGSRRALGHITPLGWVVVLREMLAPYSSWDSSELLDEIQRTLDRPLAGDARLWDPWSDLGDIIDVLQDVGCWIEGLSRLGEVAGLTVSTGFRSPTFRIRPIPGDPLRRMVDLGRVEKRVLSHAIDSQKLEGARQSWEVDSNGSKVWSQSQLDGEVIGVHRISNRLAALSGLSGSDSEDETCPQQQPAGDDAAVNQRQGELDPGRSRTEARDSAEVDASLELNGPSQFYPLHEPSTQTLSRPATSQAGSNEIQPPEGASPSASDSAGTGGGSIDMGGTSDEGRGGSGTAKVSQDETAELLKKWRGKQRGLWRVRRRDTNTHYVRVALLQWYAGNSYYHPEREICRSQLGEGGGLDCGMAKSCLETRRRRLLREVLRACHELDVDALVIPEYTMRPDTVSWLQEQLADLQPNEPKLHVWAGTFRVQYGAEAADWHSCKDFDADLGFRSILPVVSGAKVPAPIHGLAYRHRFKRYPSVAMQEIFRPLDISESLQPIFSELKSPHDVRSCITELICSEIFSVSHPANQPPLKHHLGYLHHRFGPTRDPLADCRRAAQDALAFDIEEFGRQTSLMGSRERGMRRSLLMVPAYSSRHEDFIQMAQSGYLAAGLTTVFCNAVVNHKDGGRSCFVGSGGWGKEFDADRHLTDWGPYGGVSPGIHRAGKGIPNSGKLGKTDQALVIADVDPVLALGGRPNPQVMSSPLSLVAHLPVAEFNTGGTPISVPSHGSEVGRDCYCENLARLPSSRSDLASLLKEALELTGRRRSGGGTPQEVMQFLSRLRSVSRSKDEWLKHRIQALKERGYSERRRWPPPNLVDWLVVDHGAEGDPGDNLFIPPSTGLADAPPEQT